MDKGANSGMENGFHNEEETDVLNRNELMQLTGKQLAKKAAPYSTLKLITLEKKSKAELCDIILNKTDKKADEEKPAGRAARTSSETEQFIETALHMLSAIKQQRDGEPLNAMATDVFKKQAVAYTDEKISNDEININKASTALFAISATAIVFDGVIGFKNAPTLFSKIKNKFFNRGKKQANDTK